jgi:hypothetical protein
MGKKRDPHDFSNLRLVRPISDDFNFGLADWRSNFGLS